MSIEIQDTQPTISTDRFVLRPMRASDAGLIGHYCADPRIANGSRDIPHPLPPGAAEALINRAQRKERKEDIWVLDGSAQDQGEVLGLITLARMDRNQSEVRYWVAPAFWNTGLASEALRALIDANPHEAKALFAEVFQDNPGSARVLTNCGFNYLGDAEAYCLARDATVKTWTYTMHLGA
ncbi:GNAT family N-acetyltransferase [Flavimaricola marinus]|uniref:Acetyltransferase (GNAT) family protein n=1 Tax=Flavimaricola marinus TaxID=1819565 RepID=A0A238LEI4_9RHOB|nr:GNAT family N-acetyltransferase [Flavimaricola marinus]SMY07330.1 Acetyltransferase (GNAT) family protein [Flavimaricola marinus]